MENNPNLPPQQVPTGRPISPASTQPAFEVPQQATPVDPTPVDQTVAEVSPQPVNQSAVTQVTLSPKLVALHKEIGKAVVGQDHVLSGLFCALLAGGHVLLEGVPGVAKTLMVKALAAGLQLDTKRVQFTPDLMPSDVTGQMIFSGGEFRFRQGPVFTNLLLADEINRTPPKTQASLLQAMEEGIVSIDGKTNSLPDPFMVIATENPVEYEGTYPLPEAQLDRFLVKLLVDYPSAENELEILKRHHSGLNPHDMGSVGIEPVTSASDLKQAQADVEKINVEDRVMNYIVSIIRATRQSPSLSLGASPRAAAALLKTSKAWAYLSGKGFVTPDEVKAMVKPTLRHRIIVRPELEIDGTDSDQLLDGVLAQVPVP